MFKWAKLNCRKFAFPLVVISIVFLFFLTQQVAASNVICEVGTRVQGEMGGGKVGTIEEIGTVSPHDGWYRIVFDWNAPNGDWYDPKTWVIRIAGTDTRCRNDGDEVESRDKTNTDSTSGEKAGCEFYKNYQRGSNGAKPSASLFKSVIFEWFNSINRYRDFGLEFVNFRMGAPFRNSIRGPGRKDVDPAPVGATVYPLKTKIVTCEKDVESTYRTEWTNEYSCYKNRDGKWVCKNGAPQNYKRTSFPNN